MDSTNDLIIGRSGFKGTKLMCVNGINDELRHNLVVLGFTLVDFTEPEASFGWSFAVSRYAPAIDYVKKHLTELRYVIWGDVRDLVFQTDPSVWLEKHMSPHRLLGCSEGVKICDEVTNDSWLQQVSGDDYLWVRKEEQLCSGTIAGDAEAMLALMSDIYDRSKSLSDNGFGRDQGLLNYILRLSPHKEISRVVRADESFALQGNWFVLNHYKDKWTTPQPRFDMSTGLAYPYGSDEPYAIMHQYDRDARSWLGDWKTRVETRYMGTAPVSEGKVDHVEVRRSDSGRWLRRSSTGRTA